MKVPRRRRRKPVIPINAMSDIAFLLLIFIMLLSLLNYRKEVPIEYPEAENPEVTQAEENLEIWVDRSGATYLDGEPASLSQIEGAIATRVSEEPSTRIHIIADRRTPYRHVAGVMELLQLLQHRVVSLAARQPEGGAAPGDSAGGAR